jgi:hypothetical protein
LVATLSPEQKRRVPAFFGMIDVPGGQPSGRSGCSRRKRADGLDVLHQKQATSTDHLTAMIAVR